jgi:hypothetical protein
MKNVQVALLSVMILIGNSFAATNSNEIKFDGPYLIAQSNIKDPIRDRVNRPGESIGQTNAKPDGGPVRTTKLSELETKSGVQQCPGEFALCASSTCKLTGRNIEVNINGGKSTKSYPEVVCKCPIITEAIAMANGVELSGLAGVNEGNMKGSCAVPSPDKIWSLFAPLAMYPQESANPPFQRNAQNMFAQQKCSRGTGSNCWSFLCTRDKVPTNGTQTATCFCPAGENPFGAPTQNSEFLTGAGSQSKVPQNACTQYPVSIPDIADYKKR